MFQKIIILFVVNVLLYAKTRRFKYVSDDLPVYKHPPKFKNKRHKIFLWLRGDYRWEPYRDHLLTLVIHALISVLIYLAFGASDISFLAGLLFAVNPANNQGSIWISGRGYTLPALLLLLCFSLPSLAPLFLLGCAYFTAGVLIPLVLLGSAKWHLFLWMPLIWLIVAPKFIRAVSFKEKGEAVTEDKKIHFGKVILAIKTIGFYLLLCLLPYKITFYHSFLQSCAGNTIMKKRAYSLTIFFWIGLTAIISWGIYALHKWDMISYGGLWFFITIAPFSNFRRVQQEISERYNYIPCIGLMLTLAGVIVNYPLAIVFFLTFYAVKLLQIQRAYTDDYWLVENAVYEDPGAWYAWHVRGMKRWDNGSYKEALILWVMAKLISPKEFKVLFNIAVVLKILKNDKEAEAYLKLAQENIIAGQEEQAQQIIKEFRQGKCPLLI